jgi:c-di-GMP-binding flagellar brake protein YcgR
MIERRKFIRLQAPIGIFYRPLQKNKKTKSFASLAKNIGGGGIRFLVKEELSQGSLLDLKIQIPHLHDPIHAVGEVVWISKAEAGVRFRDIASKDLHRILEYVHTIGIG